MEVLYGPKECTATKSHRTISNHYNQSNQNCVGGLDRDLMALTCTTSLKDVTAALSDMCSNALQQASDEADTNGWEMLEKERAIDLDEFFDGQGFLNGETGNLQLEENDFLRRGGSEKFIYIGNDPRLNDYLSTSKNRIKEDK